MENAFSIMKQTFKEFLKKTKWHIITIIYDVFNVYCFPYNLIHGRKKWMLKSSCELFNLKPCKRNC